MARRSIWFGTKDFATWIPAPSISGYGASSVGWSSKSQYLNGGAGGRRSTGSHREFTMTWSNKSQADLLPLMDFAQGLFGAGLIYWSDPFAEPTNIFPKDWATPQLSVEGQDGVNITNGPRPARTPVGANRYGFPVFAAEVSGFSTAGSKRALVLIPPNRDLIVRAYGQNNTGTVNYQLNQPGRGVVSMAWTAITDLNNAANLKRFSGGPNGSYAEVYLAASSTGASATINGLMGQIVPSGTTPTWQRFFSGRGHSGCRFEGFPMESPYSAPLDMIGMTANFTEMGAWQ